MLMADALAIIYKDQPQVGFMVSFERRLGRILWADHFPNKHAGDQLIKTEEEAWELAKLFAAKTVGNCVNIYVIDHDFNPVPGYEALKIDNRELK